MTKTLYYVSVEDLDNKCSSYVVDNSKYCAPCTLTHDIDKATCFNNIKEAVNYAKSLRRNLAAGINVGRIGVVQCVIKKELTDVQWIFDLDNK